MKLPSKMKKILLKMFLKLTKRENAGWGYEHGLAIFLQKIIYRLNTDHGMGNKLVGLCGYRNGAHWLAERRKISQNIEF